MKDGIEAVLNSFFSRILEIEPSIKIEEAVERVIQLVPNIEILNPDIEILRQYLMKIGEKFLQKGARARALMKF